MTELAGIQGHTKIQWYCLRPRLRKSYTNVKLQRHLENDKENMADNLLIFLEAKNPEVLFPTDEIANEVFNNNFSVLPNFVLMDAFQLIKKFGKSIKKYDNVDVVVVVVVNSKDKGLQMMRFVHDLQVYKDPQKNMSLWEPATGPLTGEIIEVLCTSRVLMIFLVQNNWGHDCFSILMYGISKIYLIPSPVLSMYVELALEVLCVVGLSQAKHPIEEDLEWWNSYSL